MNPFLRYGYQGPEYFCDRQEESRTIKQTLRSGASNITLISPRRMGKTGLIRHTFGQMSQTTPDAIFIYLDIMPARSVSEFVRMLGEKVLNALDSKHKTVFRKMLDLLKSLRPVFTADAITGSPSFTLTLEPENAEITLQQILEMLEKSGRQCFVALDEFQQVAGFKDGNAEAILRSHIQFLKNVHFLFAGSSLHMMSEMFMSAKRPFFNSTRVITLRAIEEDTYYRWAKQFFVKAGGKLSQEVFTAFYGRVEGHTWYMQAALNRLYESHIAAENPECVGDVLASLVDENRDYYENLLMLLTDNQAKLLRAIAKEGKIKAVNGSKFIRKYDLTSASSVNTALKVLADKELICRTTSGYEVTDRFMALYLASVH